MLCVWFLFFLSFVFFPSFGKRKYSYRIHSQGPVQRPGFATAGTALPGDVGNSFITGHSVLPQFADPENYRAIFTKLSDLEIGDDVQVTMAGQNFHYTVGYSKIVDPRDLSVLAPISANGRNLTLMTCVPPGTSSKRLVVITSLI